MTKPPNEMSYDELAREMHKREDSLPHLTAKAEMARRAALQAKQNAIYQLWSVIIAAVAALASAASAYFAYLSSLNPH